MKNTMKRQFVSFFFAVEVVRMRLTRKAYDVDNSLMKEVLTISAILISFVCSAQGDSLQSRIYSDFINAKIRTYDSVFSKKTEILFVAPVDKFNMMIDTKQLQYYLSDNFENNVRHKQSLSVKDSIMYFDMLPTFRIGNNLHEDKELRQLLVILLKENQAQQTDISNLKTNYKIKVISNRKSYFKMGWDKFHKKYQNCYGIIRLTRVVLNEISDRAVMYVETFRGNLDGSGDIIVMKKVNNNWTIEQYINQWVS